MWLEVKGRILKEKEKENTIAYLEFDIHLCSNELEILKHLFFECEYNKYV